MRDFASFLIDQRAATHGEVLAAIDHQLRSRLTIGRLALQLGVLDAAQVFAVLAQQARSGSARFGEVAIAMNILEPAQVEELLHEQRKRTPPLETCLVRAGVIDEAKARALREEFDALNPRTASGTVRIVPRATRRTA